MKILETERDPISEVLEALRAEPPGADRDLEAKVREVIADVRRRGDEALMELGRKLDSPELAELRVPEYEFQQAYSAVRSELLDAIRTAKSNIEGFHRRQLRNSWV